MQKRKIISKHYNLLTSEFSSLVKEGYILDMEETNQAITNRTLFQYIENNTRPLPLINYIPIEDQQSIQSEIIDIKLSVFPPVEMACSGPDNGLELLFQYSIYAKREELGIPNYTDYYHTYINELNKLIAPKFVLMLPNYLTTNPGISKARLLQNHFFGIFDRFPTIEPSSRKEKSMPFSKS